MRAALFVGLCAFACGCSAVLPNVPVTPENAQAISGCKTNANIANGAWIGFEGLTAATAAEASLGVAVPSTSKEFQIAGIVTGAAGIIMGIIHTVADGNYNGAHCEQYVTPIEAVSRDPHGKK